MDCNKVRREHPEVEWEDCCLSCHEDDDMGDGWDLWFDIFGEERHVCCAMSRSLDPKKQVGAVRG